MTEVSAEGHVDRLREILAVSARSLVPYLLTVANPLVREGEKAVRTFFADMAGEERLAVERLVRRIRERGGAAEMPAFTMRAAIYNFCTGAYLLKVLTKNLKEEIELLGRLEKDIPASDPAAPELKESMVQKEKRLQTLETMLRPAAAAKPAPARPVPAAPAAPAPASPSPSASAAPAVPAPVSKPEV